MNIRRFFPLGLILFVASFYTQWTVPQVRAQTGNASDVTGANTTTSAVTGGAYAPQQGINLIAAILNSNLPSLSNTLNIINASTGRFQQVSSLFLGAGVPQDKIEALFNTIRALLAQQNNVSSNLDSNLVSKEKSLNSNGLISQSQETISIDIQKLNAAIEAYNNIISQSSPEVLQKLAQIPEFLELRKFLQELTSAVETKL